jgi:Protein of unknown function (DUF3144)
MVEFPPQIDHLQYGPAAMTKSDSENHQACVTRFIDLANAIKNEGMEANIVSGALMTASALYASFLVAGNTGGLTESGVEKVSGVFRRELERVQKIKKKSVAS